LFNDSFIEDFVEGIANLDLLVFEDFGDEPQIY